jgi:hypothetical protein
MKDDDVREMLRRAIKQAGSQLAFAVEHDIDRTCLSSILSGNRPPSPQVIRALGLRKVTSYENLDATS